MNIMGYLEPRIDCYLTREARNQSLVSLVRLQAINRFEERIFNYMLYQEFGMKNSLINLFYNYVIII
jgi:hypothetical protein